MTGSVRAGAKEHLRLLDGLRGLAALAVVAYHFGDRADLPGLLPRGYLAVDFFFVLSGFVVARAYSDRLRTSLTKTRFMALRLVRLLPMLVPGTVFGAAIEFWRPGGADPLQHAGEVALTTLLGCLAIPWPFPTTMEQAIFPINGSIWSLFFELVANVVFVLVAKRAAPRRSVVALAAIGAVGMVAGSFAVHKFDTGPMLANWPGGFPRVLFSFFAGVLLDRTAMRLPVLPAWLFPCGLLATFCVPLFDGGLSIAFDLFVVVLVYPAMLAFAARAQVRPGLTVACDVAGEISYPIYAIHYPMVRAICFVVTRFHLPAPVRLAVAALSVAAICAVAWLALTAYDRPVRRYLGKRLLASLAPAEPPANLQTAGRWAS